MSALPFSTDFPTLAVFDAEVLQHRVRAPGDWWRLDDFRDLQEVMEGKIALLPIGREGSYRVALRVGGATEEEAALTVGSVTGLGLHVASGDVFAGAPERLPGNGGGSRLSHIPGTGGIIAVEPGDYAVTVHVLDWRNDDAHYDEDGEVRETAPVDFLVLLDPRDQAADLKLTEALSPLLDLLPKKEAKGKAKVARTPHRRRSPSPEPSRRRRGGAAPVSPGPVDAVPPPHVPEEVAPLTGERARAAFREVLYGDLLHPPELPGLEHIAMRPRDRSLLASDLPMDKLLDKVTRVRNQLRVLEAKLNAGDLDWSEKAELETPITRAYEALDALVEWVGKSI